MRDRKMKKWQPFCSLGDFKKITEEISLNKQKEKIKKLSEDQEKVINYFLMHEEYKLKITYYKQGFYTTTVGYIKNIDKINRIIYINNLKIYLKNIVKIEKVSSS